MQMTTGEEITAGLRWYLNQSPSSVAEDPRQRQKAHFFYSKVAQRLWLSAPYWFRKGDGTVTLVDGIGDMPTDFSSMGTQGQIYIQGQKFRPLVYRPPDWIKFQIENSPQAGTPWCYSLYSSTPSKAAQGIQEILCWPTDDSVLDLLTYDKKLVELIDAPLAPVATAGSGTGLTGAYTYRVTFVTSRGETEGGSISNSVTVANKDIVVSSIPIWWGKEVTSRKLYRTAAGGTQHKLVTTISNNTDTSYTDSTADGALGADVPTTANSVSGTEIFPHEFHDSALYDGLVYLLSQSQGDQRDMQLKNEWDRAVQRQWEEIQQGQNEVRAFPPFPGFISGHPVWSRWSPPQ